MHLHIMTHKGSTVFLGPSISTLSLSFLATIVLLKLATSGEKEAGSEVV